jgi:hypothetical protein
LRFLILGYGFLQGLYLNPEGYWCINRVTYEPGMLNGLWLRKDDYVNGMKLINKYYKSSSEENRNKMFSCIHWFFIGQSYKFEWEKFDAQYKVLDCLFSLSGFTVKDKITHTKRPEALAKKYKIKLPDWAKINLSKKESPLSIQRNELFHEAKYGGKPIGYSYPAENYSLELTSFNTKLIAAALGIDTPYLQVDPKDRCYCFWEIKA